MTIHGNKGYASVGASEIKLRAWTLEKSSPGTDATAIGDTFETVIGGAPKSYSGTITFQKKKGDAAQAAVVEGATVALGLYENGNDAGETYYSGDGYIETISMSQNFSDAVEYTANWRSSGIWSEETVA